MKLKTGMRGTNNGLRDLIDILPSGITMAEVGCYAGESTLMFMESGKVDLLYAIVPWKDKWDGYVDDSELEVYKYVYANMGWAETSFDFRLRGYSIIKHKDILSNVLDKLPLLDFIYIDGNHQYEYVKNDIILSQKIVKEGGIIAGHDYDNKGVIKAVDEVFTNPDKVFRDSSWLKNV